MRKGFLGAALIASVCGISPATGATLLFNSYTPNVGGSFGNSDPIMYRPHFHDMFSFVTNYARSATIDISSLMTSGDYSTNVNFISNGVKLDTKVIPVLSKGMFENRVLTNFRIPAGTHNIFVSGASGMNGSYIGSLSLSGVPEPSTWALMIGGLAIGGAALRRRRALSSELTS